MPTSLEWHHTNEAILLVTFEGNWTVDEFVETVNQVNAQITAKAPTPVTIILNMEKSAGIPRAANVLPHFQNAVTKLKYQYMIIAGGTSFGLALTRIIMQIIPQKTRTIFFEDNLAAAEARIVLLRADDQ